MMFSEPKAVERIEGATLVAGSWGDGTGAVCMMAALVPGAKSNEECVTAGWPDWLVALNIALFDKNVGTDDEDAARLQFAQDIAVAVQAPRNMSKSRDLFLAAFLNRVSPNDGYGIDQTDPDWPSAAVFFASKAAHLRAGNYLEAVRDTQAIYADARADLIQSIKSS